MTQTDKLVECLECYALFWVERYIPLKLCWCTKCQGLKIKLFRKDGKMVIKEREYNA